MSSFNLAVREITNGSWFLMSFAMWLSLAVAVYGRLKEIRFDLGAIFDERHIGLRASVAFLVWLTADQMRAAYIWLLLIGANHSDSSPALGAFARQLDGEAGFMILAGLVALLGGMCWLRVFGSDREGFWLPAWAWIGTGVASVAIPLAVWLALQP